jgi:hypothetical protein
MSDATEKAEKQEAEKAKVASAPNKFKNTSEAPAAKEKHESSEEKTMKGLKHGKDEQGQEAPDQVDQVIVNQKRKDADSKGDFAAVRDPRWPAMGNTMTIVPPADKEEAARLGKFNEELRKEADKKAESQVRTSDKEEARK